MAPRNTLESQRETRMRLLEPGPAPRLAEDPRGSKRYSVNELRAQIVSLTYTAL